MAKKKTVAAAKRSKKNRDKKGRRSREKGKPGQGKKKDIANRGDGKGDAPSRFEKESVFVSFDKTDLGIAQEVADKLEEAGVQPFFAPRHIGPGRAWQSEIYTELKDASALVAVFTPTSVASAWVLAECGAAWILGIPIFSLTMCVKTTDLPAFTGSFQTRSIETKKQLDLAVKQITMDIKSSERPPYSWTKLYAALRKIDQQLHDQFIEMDVVVGSGKGGAICGAFLAAHRGARLKVCDLRKGRAREVDTTALTKKHLSGQQVLVFEYFRHTGDTFAKIKKAAKAAGAACVNSVAVLCSESQVGSVDIHLATVKDVIPPPWRYNA